MGLEVRENNKDQDDTDDIAEEESKEKKRKIGNKQSREFPLKETFTAYFKYLRKTEYKFLNLFFDKFFIFKREIKMVVFYLSLP